MSEAEQITAEEPEATLEDFVAEMSAEGEGEAESDETQPVIEAEQLTEPEAESEQMFDVNGEQVPVSELIGGYMKGSDYTQKTQELAVQREEAESMRASVQRFYETESTPEWQPQPPAVGTEKAGLPEFATETERMLFEQNQKHEQALKTLQDKNRNREYQEALQSTDDTLFGYQKSHPDLSEQQLVQISAAVRLDDDLPYTRKSFDRVNRELFPVSADDIGKSAVAEYIERQKADKVKSEQAALEPGSAPAMSEEPPDIGNMTDEQRDALMLQDFKSMG